MALSTVSEVVTEVRRLLLDDGDVAIYRFSDAELLQGLNIALLETRRLRPDLFLAQTQMAAPGYTAVDATAVVIDPQYMLALVFYVCGYAESQNDEAADDSKSKMYYARYQSILMGLGV